MISWKGWGFLWQYSGRNASNKFEENQFWKLYKITNFSQHPSFPAHFLLIKILQVPWKRWLTTLAVLTPLSPPWLRYYLTSLLHYQICYNHGEFHFEDWNLSFIVAYSKKCSPFLFTRKSLQSTRVWFSFSIFVWTLTIVVSRLSDIAVLRLTFIVTVYFKNIRSSLISKYLVKTFLQINFIVSWLLLYVFAYIQIKTHCEPVVSTVSPLACLLSFSNRKVDLN